MVFVECFQVLTDGVLVVERLGHKHRHRVRQTQPRHDEKLQHIVQRGTVAHVRLQDGAYVLHVAQQRRGKHTLAGLHPATVAAYGIDFAVVRQEAERLRQTPCRERVRAETRMHDGQSAGEIWLGQVAEVFAHLHRRQHTFIYNVFVGKRDDVEIAVRHAPLDFLADDVELAFEALHFRHTGDEHLLDVRFRLSRALAQDGRVDRHRAEMHQRQPFAFDFFNHHPQNLCLHIFVPGQKDQSRPILSFLRHGDSLQEDKLMRYLHHDACPVTRLVVSPFRSAVFHVLKHLQGGVDQFVRLVSTYIDYHAHTTSIMLVLRTIKPASRLRHFSSLIIQNDTFHCISISFYLKYEQ